MNDVPLRPNLIDPITLEVLRNALESIADEMGAVLKRTSFSPNIKERMDASCAIFDAEAQLVAQAEHVPVHLGSMLRAVRATVDAVGALDEGDVVIVNDPFTGGSHLPDITIVAPVHFEDRHLGYVATRAHHADVGGMEPGSMPGNSREIYQEGLIIPAVKLYRRGELQDDVLRLILANVRTPEERRGDLNAQLAALRIGEQRLVELARRYGADLVTAGFEAILDYAERRMRRRLAEFPPGTYRAEDFLDDDGRSDEPVRVNARDHRVAREAGARFHRLVAAAARQHQRRRADDLFGVLFRDQGADRPGDPGQCRHLPQRRAAHPGGFFPRVAPAGRGLRRQHRDDAAHRRHGAEGLRAIRAGPGAGGEPGHDEHDRDRRP